jgi:hypothetical protein
MDVYLEAKDKQEGEDRPVYYHESWYCVSKPTFTVYERNLTHNRVAIVSAIRTAWMANPKINAYNDYYFCKSRYEPFFFILLTTLRASRSFHGLVLIRSRRNHHRTMRTCHATSNARYAHVININQARW